MTGNALGPLSDPPPGPPAALRTRVIGAYRRRMRTATGSVLLCGVSLMAAAYVFLPSLEPREEATLALHSQPVTDPWGDVAALDHALQAAYARGASEDEVAPMWHERERLLRVVHSRST